MAPWVAVLMILSVPCPIRCRSTEVWLLVCSLSYRLKFYKWEALQAWIDHPEEQEFDIMIQAFFRI